MVTNTKKTAKKTERKAQALTAAELEQLAGGVCRGCIAMYSIMDRPENPYRS